MSYTQRAGQYIGQRYDEEIIKRRKKEIPQIHIVDAKNGQLLDVLDNKGANVFWDDLHRRQLKDNLETFDFVTLPDCPAAEHLRERNRVIIPTKDGFYREFIIDEHVQNRDSLEVYTTASHIDLQKAKPIPPQVYTGQTINTILDLILFSTGWQRGITEYAGVQQVEFEEYRSPYESLRQVASDYNLELRFRIETAGGRVVGRFVDAIERTGDWRGQEIVSGIDLINAQRKENATDVVTALIGLGPEQDDGSRIVVEVYNEAAYQVWAEDGNHLWGVYTPDWGEDRVTEVTEQEVRTLTENELEKRIAAVVEYTIEGANLENVPGFDSEIIRLGDDTRIKATEYNPPLYLDARIIAIEGPISDRSKEVYTLGEFIEYSEEDINAVKMLLLKKIAKKIGLEKLEEFTYSKTEITQLDTSTLDDAKTYASTEDERVYQDSTLYTDQQKQNLTNDIENGLLDIPGGSITDFIELANVTLRNAASTVYTDDQGNFFFVDPNNTDNIVKITAEGIGVSTNGILGPFTNAITGLGINATAIVTGFMSFERARGGFLQIGGEDNDLGRFIVYGANGTPVADIDNGKASFLDISAENFTSPVVPRLNTQTYTLRVDPLNGDDSGTGLGPWDTTGPDSPLKTLSEAFRRLPQVNEGEITIQLHYYNSGDVAEGRMELKGVSGSGRIIIDGQHTATTVNGSLFVEGCTNEIIMQDITINSTAYAIIDWRRSSGALTNVILYGNMQSTVGLDVTQGFLDMDNVEIYDATLTVLRGRNANIYAINTKGLGGSYGIFAQRNAKIGVHGTIPGGGISATLEDYGGTIDGLENTTVDLGSATPPAPPETTQTWDATDAATWHIGFNLWDDYYGATPTQGEWGGSGPYSGFWFFGADLSTTLTGKSISQLQVYIQRQGGGGYSGPVTHYIRWHGHATQPGSPADESQSSDVVTVNLATGDSAWVTLPISFRTAFENGSAKGIGVYTSNTSNAYYSRLQPGAKIKATYQ